MTGGSGNLSMPPKQSTPSDIERGPGETSSCLRRQAD